MSGVLASIRSLRGAVLGAACVAVIAVTGPASASNNVPFPTAKYPTGTIVVKTSQRQLYLSLGNGRAVRYVVGVGRPGKKWVGTTYVRGKHLRPAWSPPAEIKRDNPRLPDVIPAGSPQNPMGAAALTLGYGEYAIHGTNRPGSVGGYVSYGCIRMYNDDVLDLYSRVRIGTRVIVLP